MQNTFSLSGNDSKWFKKKIIFQNRYMALETPSTPRRDPPPLHGKYHLKFPFWLFAPFPKRNCIAKGTTDPIPLTFPLKKNVDPVPKLYNNDLKSGRYRIPKLPPLSVKYVCSNSHKTNHQIMISKIVLKSVLWRDSESALNCCIFQLLCFSLHPIVQ